LAGWGLALLSFSLLMALALVRRSVSRRRRTRAVEEALRFVAEALPGRDPSAVFETLVAGLARSLGTRWAVIGRLDPGRTKVHVLAFWDGDHTGRPFTYDLAGTPCGDVVEQGLCHFPRRVTSLFPQDRFLRQIGAEGYVGRPLRDSAGRPIGLCCAFHDRTLKLPQWKEALFHSFVRRAEAELHRLMAVEELEQSEARFRTVVENAPYGILAVGSDGRILWGNPTATSLAAREGPLGGHPLGEILPVPFRKVASVREWFREKSQGKGSVRMEALMNTPRGDVPVEICVGEFHQGDEWVLGVALQDISRRKADEAFLAGQARVFEMMAKGAPLRETLETLCRVLEERAPGMRCSVLILDEEGRRLLHGAAPSLPGAYNRLVHGLVIGPCVGSCGTAAYRRQRVIVEDIETDPLWAPFRDAVRPFGLRACWSEPVFSSRGELLGTFAMYYNEPRRPTPAEIQLIETAAYIAGLALERAKREGEQRRLVRAIEASADAVVMTDVEGKICYVNPAFSRITGYEAAEAIGENPRILKSGCHDEAFYEELWRVISSGNVWRGRLINKRKDGSLYHASLTIAPITSPGEGITGYVGVQRDVTQDVAREEKLLRLKEELAQKAELLERRNRELEEARSEALRASQAKSEFLANMSHEIRTPLNGIVAFLDLLSQSSLTREQRDYLCIARSSCDTLLAVINDILDFSKIEAGRLELFPSTFEPARLVEEVSDLLAPQAQAKGLEFLCDLHIPEGTTMRGDALRIRQILINLAGNAVKFTDRGHVSVSASLQGVDNGTGRLCLAVEDTGIGIPEDQLERLFDAFTQVDGSATRRFQGTGLGLAITRRLVEMMDGSIRVQSRLGQGSRFEVELPLPLISQGAGTRDLAGTLALVLDGHPEARRSLGRLLRELGADVVTAADPAEALRDWPLDRWASGRRIVLLDVEMAGSDLVDRFRRADGGPTTIIGMARAVKSRKWEESCCDTMLLKPVKRRDLLRVLGRHPGSVPREPSPPGGQPAGERRLRILLAEDHPVNQKVAQTILGKAGHDVVVAENGREALQWATKEPFDLILMDVQMPVMDGLEAARRIREAGVRDIPIVALTARVLPPDRAMAREAGMNDFVPKPFRPGELLEVVQRWGRRRLGRREGCRCPSDAAGSDSTGQAVGASGAGCRSVSEGESDMDRHEEIRQGILNWLENAGLLDDKDVACEVVSLFLEDSGPLLERIAQVTSSAEELRQAAHRLKGAALNLGLEELGRIAKEMEQAAANGSAEEAARHLPALQSAYETAAEVLRDLLREWSSGQERSAA
jgi:PAS domain S-box-containing protein